MTKMEEKIFEKFDSELSAKKDIEAKIAQYLEVKFNMIGVDLQNQSKIKYKNFNYTFSKYIKCQVSIRVIYQNQN